MHLRNSNSVQWYKAALKHSLLITCLWHLSHKHKYSVLAAFNIRLPFITISCVNVSYDAFSPPMFSIHSYLINKHNMLFDHMEVGWDFFSMSNGLQE